MEQCNNCGKIDEQVEYVPGVQLAVCKTCRRMLYAARRVDNIPDVIDAARLASIVEYGIEEDLDE